MTRWNKYCRRQELLRQSIKNSSFVTPLLEIPLLVRSYKMVPVKANCADMRLSMVTHKSSLIIHQGCQHKISLDTQQAVSWRPCEIAPRWTFSWCSFRNPTRPSNLSSLETCQVSWKFRFEQKAVLNVEGKKVKLSTMWTIIGNSKP